MYIDCSIVNGQSRDQFDEQIPSNFTQLTISAQGADADVHLADLPSESADLNDESLKALLLDDNLLRLYRTGVNRLVYTAEEDDIDDVSITYCLFFLL